MRGMEFDREQERRLAAAAERIPDDAVDEISVSGDPERAIERIEAFRDAGADNLVLIPVGDFETTRRRSSRTSRGSDAYSVDAR